MGQKRPKSNPSSLRALISHEYDLDQKNSTMILWSVDALVVNGGDLGQGKYIFVFVEEMNLNNRKVGNFSIK